MSTKRPGTGRGWDEFGMALVLHLVFPLLPLVLEWWLKVKLTPATLTLSLAMYAFGIANSTRIGTCFAVFILTGFVAGVFYGVAEVKDMPAERIQLVWLGLALVFAVHAAERFYRHVLDGEKFLEFVRSQ